MKKISFTLYFPYQWFIYKNIYSQIPDGQREVIVDLSVNHWAQNGELEKDIFALLQREKVDFRVLERPNCLSKKYFQDFFSDVEVIVSCWENGCVVSAQTARIKKVNMTYGIAKELTLLRPTRSVYDVILAYGKRDQKYFGLLTKSIAIGNPRLDNFYKGVIDVSVRENLLNFFDDTKKKTVLYVPTHGDLGSFREMLGTVGKLSKEYNIIFKPHYFTLREDKEMVEKYRQIKSILVIDDSWDTIEVMALSDVIISDNSSAIFDAMQVDKPVIVCDFLDYQFLDTIHKKLRLLKRGVAGALTYPESLEQEIKNKDLVASIKKPSDLIEMLANIEKVDLKYEGFRRKLVLENFEYVDGHSARKAAEIIISIYNSERKHVPGILQHAYRAYNNPRHQWIIENENKEQVLSVNKKTLVWIFCERDQNPDEILGTLYSAFNEKEVALVCVSGTSKDAMKTILQKELSGEIRFFEHHSDAFCFIYSQLSAFDYLLFVKANARIENLNTIINFKLSCKRDMLFFAENVTVDASDRKKCGLFYLLKNEILMLRSVSRDTFITVSSDMLNACEKSAVFIENKALLPHTQPVLPIYSFENILAFFIRIDSLKAQGRNMFGLISNEYALMPNCITNIFESKSDDVFKQLIEKGMTLHSVGIPIRRWPDKKITEFLFKIISGDFRYYQLLKLVISKIFYVQKYVFLRKIMSFLERMSARRNGR